MLNGFIRATLLISLISVPSVLRAQTVRSSLSAFPESYSGPCPTSIRFSGVIATSRPGPVTYQWVYSDGIQSPPTTIKFDKIGMKSVENTWKIRTSYEGWLRIVIVDPVKVASERATIRIHCQSEVQDRFRFVVLGDSQDDDNFKSLLQWVAVYRPDFVVFVGDIATDPELQNWWGRNRMWRDLNIPVYNVLGNHEIGNEEDEPLQWLQLQQRYQLIFGNLPTNGPPGYEHLAYSFEYRNSVFVILDSFYIEPRSGLTYWSEISQAQLDWFTNVLNQSRKAHRFAFAHAPARLVKNLSADDQLLERWLLANDFDVFFAGHEHLYARLRLGNQTHPVQIISGGASGDETEFGDLNRIPEVYKPHHHFVVVDVDGSLVSIQAIDKNNLTIDRYSFSEEPKD